ncbi:MAG: class I SAM-dependent methyltransferase [Micromonosporaceae bacterium]
MRTIGQLSRPQNMPHGLPGWIDAQLMPRGHEPQYARAAALLDLQPDDDLLEVACGVGALLQRHAAHVRHVTGLDHSQMQVGFARQRLADRIAAGTAEVVLGDAVALPWEDGRFSAVVCLNGLELMPGLCAPSQGTRAGEAARRRGHQDQPLGLTARTYVAIVVLRAVHAPVRGCAR